MLPKKVPGPDELLGKFVQAKLGLLTNKRRNKNYGSLPLGCSTPVSSSAKGPRGATPPKVPTRNDFGGKRPDLWSSATSTGGGELETGNLGGESQKKEALAMRETEEETTIGRRDLFGSVNRCVGAVISHLGA